MTSKDVQFLSQKSDPAHAILAFVRFELEKLQFTYVRTDAEYVGLRTSDGDENSVSNEQRGENKFKY